MKLFLNVQQIVQRYVKELLTIPTSLENVLHNVIHHVGVSFVRKKIMYKFVYEENGIPNTITSIEKRPLELLMRHLFHLYGAYKEASSSFEVIFFGKEENYKTE